MLKVIFLSWVYDIEKVTSGHSKYGYDARVSSPTRRSYDGTTKLLAVGRRKLYKCETDNVGVEGVVEGRGVSSAPF
jgi:hypothetical protein